MAFQASRVPKTSAYSRSRLVRYINGFYHGLPDSEGCTNMIVITDRLSKGVIADGLKKMMQKELENGLLKIIYLTIFFQKR